MSSAERVVRIVGDVVHRPAKPWTPTVQRLLRHLHDRGLPVPEPLGHDGEHEYVGLVPGEAGADEGADRIGPAGVRSAGELLRRVHDATVGWRPPPDAVWSVPHRGGPVICHGDPKPANLAWQDGRAVGLFDFDAARPGERIDDVAYALTWFTPFEVDPDALRQGFAEPAERHARIEAFLTGYGWAGSLDVRAAVLRRREQAIDEVVRLGERGDQPQATWLAEGRPDRWRAGLAALRTLRLPG